MDIYYDGYSGMSSSAKNWEHHCTYQLLPNALKGHHQALQLYTMQLGYVERPGGFMYDADSPKDCFSFVVIEECAGKACIDDIKIQSGDIVFFDDNRSVNFITNDNIKLCAVNLKKDEMKELLPLITQALYRTIKDTDGILSHTLRNIWKQFTDHSDLKKDKDTFKNAEEEVNTLLIKLLTDQTPMIPKLTKGEKTVLEIRDQVYHHMDGKIKIDSLVKQYKISKKTLYNSFKSLFGFTPDYFLRQLKLNLVHNDLKKGDPAHNTVSQAAQKWGFTHMGHFSGYYAKLFGETPSQTLHTDYHEDMAIIENACVSRQEEIT